MAGILRSAVGVATVVATVLLLPPGASADPIERAVARADAPATQLNATRTTIAPGGGVVQRYEQRVGGLPVFGAEVVAVDGAETAPMLVSDSTVPGLESADAPRGISRAQAVEAAREATGVERLRAPADAELGIDSVSERLVWEIVLPAADPIADWSVVVDARTGEKLRARDLLWNATGSASLYDPNPVVLQGGYQGLKDKNDRDYALLTSLLLPAALERLTVTTGCLKGLYVDARLKAKGKKVCAPGADFSGLTRSSNKFEAVMAYYHVDATRFYVDSLGLSEPLRQKPQKVYANAIPDDNSFYSSATHEMVLGTGGVDDGEDADVIVHEYGHSLQDQAAPRSLRKREGQTLGEGFGDYIAAAMSQLSTGGSPFDTCIFDWDGISYSPDGTCGRYADIDLTVTKAERKCAKQIHCVGQIWSSALFDLREQLGVDSNGQSIMDRVVLEANFLNTRKTGYRDAGRALLAADQLLYAGANSAAIEAELVARKFCGAGGC